MQLSCDHVLERSALVRSENRSDREHVIDDGALEGSLGSGDAREERIHHRTIVWSARDGGGELPT